MLTILTNECRMWHPPKAERVELDLGCGKGGFLVQLAHKYPDACVIGVDVMIGRLRKVMSKCKRAGLKHVEVVRCAAGPLMTSQLPDSCLDRVHILCPDPWPKKRHRKNRLVTSEFLARVSTKIKPGGTLHLGTDNVPYFEQMLSAIRDLPMYEMDNELIADIKDLKTDFEKKFAGQGIDVQHRAWRVRG